MLRSSLVMEVRQVFFGGRPVGAEAGGSKMNTKDLPRCSMPAGPGVSSGQVGNSAEASETTGAVKKEPERLSRSGESLKGISRK